MAPKTILACLMNKEHADAVLRCAVPLARTHNAHLIGLHTLEALLVYPGIAIHVPDPTFAAFNASQKQEAAAIEKIFKKHTMNEDFPSEWRLLKTEDTSAAVRIIESAHCADLVMMPQEDNTVQRGDQHHVQARVIRECGRPVIVVPPEFDGPPVGKTVVLGWSNTREAARAAHDLIFVVPDNCTVKVTRVGLSRSDDLHDSETVDLANALDRHGLDTELVSVRSGSRHVADALLKHAFEQGADMIAVGAFGHSRVYDLVLGAVTFDLLRDAEIPVLFSC